MIVLSPVPSMSQSRRLSYGILFGGISCYVHNRNLIVFIACLSKHCSVPFKHKHLYPYSTRNLQLLVAVTFRWIIFEVLFGRILLLLTTYPESLRILNAPWCNPALRNQINNEASPAYSERIQSGSAFNRFVFPFAKHSVSYALYHFLSWIGNLIISLSEQW